MELAPIVLFVYNRPWHTEQTLNALASNRLANESTLYIYADGQKDDATAEELANINNTRNLIKGKKYCKEVFIIESEFNLGLANAIIKGVTEIVNKYGKIIVLEDDLVTHPFFLTYMNRYLEIYANSESVISLHGFMYPIKKKISSPFFLKGADCWGWATWKRGWDLFEHNGKLLLDRIVQKNAEKEFNFNNSYNYMSLLEAQIAGKVNSWAVRWYASAFLLNKLTLYPPISLVQNIGFDGSGTHKDYIDSQLRVAINAEEFEIKVIGTSENKNIKKRIEKYFRGNYNFLRSVKELLLSFYRNIKPGAANL
ncbi:MAG TPA: glycosyltransferase family 2 protein [Mucilaginibacter sp.]|jgi:hypothetical protein